MSLAKALRVTLAKVADDLCNMAMAAIGIKISRVDGPSVAPLLEGPNLLLLLDGPMGRNGAAVLDLSLVSGLVQQNTIGKVLEADGDVERQMTSTDAAICAPILDQLLMRAAELPDDREEGDLLRGVQFGAQVPSPRLMLMALEAPEYRVITLTIDLAGGKRQGVLTLILPELDAAARVDPAAAKDPKGKSTPAVPPVQKTLARTVLSLNTDLRVRLDQLRMPWVDLNALKVGDTLPLVIQDFSKVDVVTTTGAVVARGTLGQIKGTRAVRLFARPKPLTQPRRRASDREGLNLPEVEDEGINHGPKLPQDRRRDEGPATSGGETAGFGAAPSDDGGMGAMPDMADMPDMSDLPGMDDAGGMDGLGDLPDMPDMSDLPGLSDMPDMDDLPDLSDLPELADLPPLK